MTFDEAWAAHLKRQNIIPPNQQTFRHGWNAALVAAAEWCNGEAQYGDPDDYGSGRNRGCEACAEGVRQLQVEVET